MLLVNDGVENTCRDEMELRMPVEILVMNMIHGEFTYKTQLSSFHFEFINCYRGDFPRLTKHIQSNVNLLHVTI